MLLQYHNRMGTPLYYSPYRDARINSIWNPGLFTPGTMANFTEEMQLPASPMDFNNSVNESDEEGAMCIVAEATNNEEDVKSADDDGTDNFICKWNTCGRQFDTPDNLAQHVTTLHATQSRGGQYFCCWRGCARSDRGFNARYKMLVHIRTHTKEKPHKCSICEKRFSRAENLKIHLRSHSGERPYVCPVLGCNKAYSNSSDRFKHTKTHSTDRPYYCKIPGCHKRYTDPSSLRKHVKTFKHHAIQSAEKPEPDQPECKVINSLERLHTTGSPTIPVRPDNVITKTDLKSPDGKTCNCTHECFEHLQKASEIFKISALLNNFANQPYLGKEILSQNLDVWGKLWNPLLAQDFIKNNISTGAPVLEKQIAEQIKIEHQATDSMDLDVPLDLSVHK